MYTNGGRELVVECLTVFFSPISCCYTLILNTRFLANNPVICSCEVVELLQYAKDEDFTIGGSCHNRNGGVSLLSDIAQDGNYCGKLLFCHFKHLFNL